VTRLRHVVLDAQRSSDDDPLAQDLFHRAAARFGAIWSAGSLSTTVRIAVSPRLTRSLGRADVRQRRITLAAGLTHAGTLLDQVLCHELAHIVAFDRVGRSEGPHGPTWQYLVSEAGYAPQRRLPGPASLAPIKLRSTSRKYAHRCPVCSFVRVASRRMPRWRCADCVLAGLDGHLDITELAVG
jgi:predicted SprT family Zn-dependent metalloprotease